MSDTAQQAKRINELGAAVASGRATALSVLGDISGLEDDKSYERIVHRVRSWHCTDCEHVV